MAIRPDQRAIVVLARCLCDATDVLCGLRAEHERPGVTKGTQSIIRATLGPLEEAAERLTAAMAAAVGFEPAAGTGRQRTTKRSDDDQ